MPEFCWHDFETAKAMANWYKNAVFYSLDVETFVDSNGDGIGDLQGLISRLDYLSGLGVTCIWLLPFFSSPNRDSRYDVKDYYSIDPALGHLGDFAQLMERCRSLGIRVMIDLVINHTSIHHPWFKEARKSQDSVYRDFYIWSDKPKPFHKDKLIFHGEENTLWTYDETSGQYYLHRFYKEQPDLNIGCPKLRAELLRILNFWLSLGVNAFRIDAAEMLVESYGMEGVEKKYVEQFLEEMRMLVAGRDPEVILVAEANIPPSRVKRYFSDSRRMHMLFNFYGNQQLFLALARGNGRAMGEGLKRLPDRTADQQWLNFLRHHDELSLALLGSRDAQSVISEFAPDKNMLIYKTGIRRRLAPMVDNNQVILQMLYSLLFSLPGAVLLRYGDEIGMGDDLSLDGRMSVRTPMQWSSSKHAGFSNGTPRRLVHPLIDRGMYAYDKVNVLDQQRDPASLLNFIERLITTRRQSSVIGSGTHTYGDAGCKELLVHRCSLDPVTMGFVHNFSDQVITVPLPALLKGYRFSNVLCDSESAADSDLLIMKPYGFLWLRMEITSDTL